MQISEFILPSHVAPSAIDAEPVLAAIQQQLRTVGWAALRHFDPSMASFSALINALCHKVTFDPARRHSSINTQKVDAGTAPIGLHIENGNTPFAPDLVAFYCARSARAGSQTTLCDGHALYRGLSAPMKALFSQTLTVSRTLPPELWQRYAVNEHPQLQDLDAISEAHLQQIFATVPNLRARLVAGDALHCELDIQPIRRSKFSNKSAFANAVLGPSFNYETPRYVLANGVEITAELKAELAAVAEQYTWDIPWQDGDIVVIDNTRVMHGRRAVIDADHRSIYIGMGSMA